MDISPVEPEYEPADIGVAAIIVVSPPKVGRQVTFEQTLRSVLHQSFPPKHVLIADASGQPPAVVLETIRQLEVLPANTKAPEELRPSIKAVNVSGAKNFGIAVEQALAESANAKKADWIWLLHDDVVANTDTLENLLDAGKNSASIAAIGPKQVRYGAPNQILQLGIDATRTARRVYAIEPDEIDQGQYDDRDDVLAVGTAGMLVRQKVWNEVGGLDANLGPFGDGLEYGRRLHLAGYRVVVVPRAIVQHEQSTFDHSTGGRTSYSARRAAQLYNWALTLPTWADLGFMIWLPLLTIARVLGRLVTGAPALAGAEASAYFRFLRKYPSLVAARRRLRSIATVPTSVLRGLEADASQISKARRSNRKVRAKGTSVEIALDMGALATLRTYRLRSAGALAALLGTTLLISVLVWYPYSGGIQGGQWGALPGNWFTLADQAWSGWQLSGDGAPGPANPILLPLTFLSAPFALVGISPTRFAEFIFYLALPLAAWGGWSIAGSLTRSTVVKASAGALWASSGALLLPMMRGDLAGVLAFLALAPLFVGLYRGVRAPTILRSRGVSDVVVVTRGDRISWIALAGISALMIVSSAPIVLVLAPVLALSLVLFPDSGWERVDNFAPVSPPGLLTKISAVAAVFIAPLVFVSPVLAAQITRGGFAAVFDWFTNPSNSFALGMSDPTDTVQTGWHMLLGLPSLLPLAPADLSWAEAAQRGLFPILLVVGGAAAGLVLFIWSFTAFATSAFGRGGRFPLTAAAWFAGVFALALALVQEKVLPGAGAASSVLVAVAGMSFLVAISARYGGYTLPAYKDGRALQSFSGRLARGVPGTVALSLSLVSVVFLLVLGPIGLLRGGAGEAVSAGGVSDNPLLAPSTSSQSGAEDPLKISEGDEAAEQAGSQTQFNADSAAFLAAQFSTFIQPAVKPTTPIISQESQQGPRAARLLTLQLKDGVVHGMYLRGAGMQLADLQNGLTLSDSGDTSAQSVSQQSLLQTIAALTSSPSEDSAKNLANHAIDIVMLAGQSDDFTQVENLLDATAGLERIGSVGSSVMWRVRPTELAPSRTHVVYEDETSVQIDSGPVAATSDYSSDRPGTLVLAEVADPGWKASLDGVVLEPAEDPSSGLKWRQAFLVPEGTGLLRVDYHQEYLMWWWVASGLVFGALALALIPWRARLSTFTPVMPTATEENLLAHGKEASDGPSGEKEIREYFGNTETKEEDPEGSNGGSDGSNAGTEESHGDPGQPHVESAGSHGENEPSGEPTRPVDKNEE